MRIKTQSLILMAGIALMPIIVVSLFLVVVRLNNSSREARRYESLGADLSLKGNLGDEEILALVTEHKPKDIEVAVADPEGRIIHSTIPGITKGQAFQEGILAADGLLGRERILILGLSPPLPPGYRAVTAMPRTSLLPSDLLGDYILAGALALSAILAFAAIMSILIVRSITVSVLSLEEATRRVAAGDLELPIAAKGSNEMASLGRSLNSLRLEIKEDQARRARFIMGVSHDLKTPIALVKGYAEALEGEVGPQGAAYLGIIQDKTDQLESMIDDLIDFVRVGTGEWSGGLKDVVLLDFLQALLGRLKADAALLRREVRATLSIPRDLALPMDERLASRALENIAYNALRYMPEGRAVELRAWVEGQAIHLELADEGPGIAPEDLPHIFEPFYRGSNSRREQGLGLGLSIVKTVVESHGWTIGVKSVPGSGTTFRITLPLGR